MHLDLAHAPFGGVLGQHASAGSRADRRSLGFRAVQRAEHVAGVLRDDDLLAGAKVGVQAGPGGR
jgi:hypothetical protein